MKIFLVGFMGSGKSYWGSRWAERYQLSFADLDTLIGERENKTIAEIFGQRGEAYFREAETACLRSFPTDASFIMACGGGAPCFNDNMKWMNERGTTVYLAASPQLIYDRVIGEIDKRPLLKHTDASSLLSFIEQKLKEREPFYKQAKCILPVDALNDESLSILTTLHS